MHTSGGASIMGSYPYPRNGHIAIDYEFILLFKKLGQSKNNIPKIIKEKSKLSNEEWRKFFTGHWNFAGEKQNGGHIAMFPEELPRRLIKMFSFVGENVLDPFLGSGTTSKVARDLDRNSIGYEINKDFLPIIEGKIGIKDNLLNANDIFEVIYQNNKDKSFKSQKTKQKNNSAVLNNRINDPDYWKQLKNANA